MHWAGEYIGRKWRHDQDCLYWYRRIKKEQFGRDVALCDVDHDRLLRSASRIMTGDVNNQFGYRQTASPIEGDAVFLSQRNQPHHIGMLVVVDGKNQVLHALESAGVVLSDMDDLAMNSWTIKGYWTDAS